MNKPAVKTRGVNLSKKKKSIYLCTLVGATFLNSNITVPSLINSMISLLVYF